MEAALAEVLGASLPPDKFRMSGEALGAEVQVVSGLRRRGREETPYSGREAVLAEVLADEPLMTGEASWRGACLGLGV